MREMVFGLDADFSEEAFVTRLNAELANDLGNLASRATTLVNLLGGPEQAPQAPRALGSAPAEPGRSSAPPGSSPVLRASFEKALGDVRDAMEDFAFQRALAAIWEFVREVNRYVDTMQPWALAKRPDAKEQLDAVLYDLAESLRLLGIVLQPFIPDAATKLRAAVGQEGAPTLADAAWGRLAAGTPVRKLSGLFPRVDDKARATPEAPAAKDAGPASPRIAKDEFGRVELRVAEVLAAEAVPKSKKLLKLTVSLGAEQRTVVAGIAEHYAPADLVGKRVVIVANLEKAKLMGVESNGMVLAGSADGKLAVLTIDRDLPAGARVT
jgi:methionyl-tRNA synthetase